MCLFESTVVMDLKKLVCFRALINRKKDSFHVKVKTQLNLITNIKQAISDRSIYSNASSYYAVY